MSQENIYPYTVSLGGFLFERDVAGALRVNSAPAEDLTPEELSTIESWIDQEERRVLVIESGNDISVLDDVLLHLSVLREKKAALYQSNTLLGEVFQTKVKLALRSGVLGDEGGHIYKTFDYLQQAHVEPDTKVPGAFALSNSEFVSFVRVSQTEPANPKKNFIFRFAGLYVEGGPHNGDAQIFTQLYVPIVSEHPEIAIGTDDSTAITEGIPVMHPNTKAKVKEIFLGAGFSIKEGETDLKDYVYDAAVKLLAWGKYSGV